MRALSAPEVTVSSVISDGSSGGSSLADLK
jgi:hypothetical protein